MKPSTKDQIEAKLHEVKGPVKQAVGKITPDPSLEVSGGAETSPGRVQRWVNRVEKAVGE